MFARLNRRKVYKSERLTLVRMGRKRGSQRAQSKRSEQSENSSQSDSPQLSRGPPTCIVVVSQKGGIAKTTTAYNYADWLDKQGYRTLLIDLDPQCDATSGFGVPASKHQRKGEHRNRYFLTDLLRQRSAIYANAASGANIANNDGVSLWDVVIPVGSGKLKLLPGDEDLGAISLKPTTLATRIKPFIQEFDFCVIDVNPDVNVLLSNAILAAATFPRQSILVPMHYGKWEREGLNRFLTTLEDFSGYFDPLAHLFVFLARIDGRVRNARKAALEELEQFGDRLLRATVRQNQAVQDAPDYGESIFGFSPRSQGARDYDALFREHLSKLNSSSAK